MTQDRRKIIQQQNDNDKEFWTKEKEAMFEFYVLSLNAKLNKKINICYLKNKFVVFFIRWDYYKFVIFKEASRRSTHSMVKKFRPQIGLKECFLFFWEQVVF